MTSELVENEPPANGETPSLCVAREVTGWTGVSVAPSRFGGKAFSVNGALIGSVGGHRVDVPFSPGASEEIVRTGAATHHRFCPSGWVSCRLQSAGDIPGAIALLRRSYRERM